jgi:hypothetical protein
LSAAISRRVNGKKSLCADGLREMIGSNDPGYVQKGRSIDVK